ncbi:hypothetical protein [Capnocytophaga canimorsus]|uniref:hypothetical protein n=1 Tax=Capnocytophaga canimorsus TaxID=28188 RepID=UPI0037D71963
MKSLFLSFVFLFPLCDWAQDFQQQYVIIPKRFDFMKTDNEFQLNELTKFLFEKNSFKTFWENEIPTEIASKPCELLKASVSNSSGMFITKLTLKLTNCTGKEVFTSEIGKSKEKEFKRAYQQALREAFSAENKLAEFRKNNLIGTSKDYPTTNVAKSTSTLPILYAQPNELGFQLIDSSPKIILKIQKTSLPDIYIAQTPEGMQGILFKNQENSYTFEFIKSNTLTQDKFEIKF